MIINFPLMDRLYIFFYVLIDKKMKGTIVSAVLLLVLQIFFDVIIDGYFGISGWFLSVSYDVWLKLLCIQKSHVCMEYLAVAGCYVEFIRLFSKLSYTPGKFQHDELYSIYFLWLLFCLQITRIRHSALRSYKEIWFFPYGY